MKDRIDEYQEYWEKLPSRVQCKSCTWRAWGEAADAYATTHMNETDHPVMWLANGAISTGDTTVVTDPETGGRKGAKLAQFSQIPADVLWELAEHYGVGAEKYPDEPCRCGTAQPAENSASTTPSPAARPATCGSGTTQTPATAMPDAGTNSPRTSTPPSSLGRADSAERLSVAGSLTTTMRAALAPEPADGASGGRSATDATCSSASSSKSTARRGTRGHLPGCNAGRANWQRGYDWRLSVDALMRHLMQFLQGEDYDAENGHSHLIAVIWHAAALRYFQIHDLGRDFRDAP